MPIIVPSRTIQSSAFMQSSSRTARAAPRPAQKRRRQKCKCRARCESPARAVTRRGLKDRLAVTSFAEGNQICEKPVGAGHASGKLPEEHEAGVNEIALAVLRDKQPTFQR